MGIQTEPTDLQQSLMEYSFSAPQIFGSFSNKFEVIMQHTDMRPYYGSSLAMRNIAKKF